jgi:hypothetical protein
MKLIRVLLLTLLLALPAQAALTVSSRGTGGNTTAAATITITPGSNLAAGSMAVLILASDNTGSGGNTSATPASETDSVGNTWTKRLSAIYDPGAASAGVELSIYTAHLTTALTTSNNLVLDFVSVQPPAKSWALLEVVPGAGKIATFVTGAAGTGAASATPTVTTSSITSGHVVIGGGGSESTLTWTGDADTSNGNWTNEQEIGNGTGTSGMAVTSQAKITTGTATQTYNPTQTSADQIIGWIQIQESDPVSRRPVVIL